MRWNDGDIDLDADDSDPDHIVFHDGDSAFDLELEESLKLEWEERRKNLDISFPVPDLSDCRNAETVDAWVESPKLMLETLTFRLNEILERCEPRSYGFVLELKPEYITLQGKSILINMSCTLNNCGDIVDLVNTIRPTPFKGEILVQLGKSILPGKTSELTRLINCYKRELWKLAEWIKAIDKRNGNESSVAPRPIVLIPSKLVSNHTQSEEPNVSPETAKPTMTPPTVTGQHQTVRGTFVQESELTKDERPCGQWCIILGYANPEREPIPKTTFHNRIRGEGSNPLDAVLVRGQKYRIRQSQMPTEVKTEGARNSIIEAAPPSKRGKKKEQ